MAYSIQQLLSDVKSLGVGNSFPYVNSDQKICKLDAVDDGQQRISFTFTNNTTTPPTVENGNFTQDKLQLVANALSAGNAINIDAVLNGGGNKRAVLESFLAHTEHVFVCYVNGAKHIFWSSQYSHDGGKMCYFAPGVTLEKYMPASQMETEFKQWLVQQPSRGQSGLFGAGPASMYCNGLKTCLQDPVFAKVFVKNLFEVQDAACFEVLVNTIKKVPGYNTYNLGWNNQALNAAMGKYKKYLDAKAGIMSVTGNGASALNSGFYIFLAAIRTKPFILLAGISGTGKSRIVRQLARGCCPEIKDGHPHPLRDEQKPGNFELIPVRPNWHDSTELMGYVTRTAAKPEYVMSPFVEFLAKAWLFPGVPFFLCLDEMNLAPVEQYFAEYLSVIESRKLVDGKIQSDVLIRFDVARLDSSEDGQKKFVEQCVETLLKKYWTEAAWSGMVDAARVQTIRKMFVDDKGIRIPSNLVVMGTVNMDETTCSFSRKVLDRAMSFELNDVEDMYTISTDGDPKVAWGAFNNGVVNRAKQTYVTAENLYAETDATKKAANMAIGKKVLAYLKAINTVLDKTPFKVAYRTRNEMMLYCVERGGDLAKALDEVTSMKILSRVEGDENAVRVTNKLVESAAVVPTPLPTNAPKNLIQLLKLVIMKQLGVVDGTVTNAAVAPSVQEYETLEGKYKICAAKLDEMNDRLLSGYTGFWR